MNPKTRASLRGLIVGGGSIGERHLRNLKTLGVESLTVVEPRRERSAALQACGAAVVGSLDDAGTAFDFAIVATPTHLHADQACGLAAQGIALFIEKPLALSLEQARTLESTVREKGVTTLVGCNMRFHPGPVKLKALLADGAVGTALFSKLHSGSYLPQWRPASDYRQSYSAQASQGGGVLLDCIHEMDLARWFFGDVAQVTCMSGHLSSLEIDTEDVAMLVLRHRSGSLSQITLDYVQRNYDRGVRIVGETGILHWDFSDNQVVWFDSNSDKKTAFPLPPEGVSSMYVEEMRHFLDCVWAQKPTCCPVAEAARTLEISIAAKESSATHQHLFLKP